MDGRFFEFFEVDMNAASSFTGDLPVDVVNVAVGNMDMFKSAFFFMCENANTKEVALIF